MNKIKIIQEVAKLVEKKFKHEGTGHDWYHIERVWKMAKHIARQEKGVDVFIVELGALLHDIADWKFHNGDLDAGPREAARLLKLLKADQSTIERVCHIVKNVSFKGSHVAETMKTKEGKIVQDADRLDAMGAVGIMRNFVYAGAHAIPAHIPGLKPRIHKTFDEYKTHEAAAIHHFYEKLLLLKGRMNTKTGKKIATNRHKIMEKYLKEFYAEWKGKL